MFANNFNSYLTSPQRKGFSLLELLIAMVMTLIVLGAMMAAFSYGSREMHRGRAAIDLSNRLQAANALLRNDLEQITVDVRPHHFLPSPPNGYLEIVDGPRRDYNASDYSVDATTNANNSRLGDTDDYISFTMKSDAEPFRNRSTRSHYAEVHWYLVGRTLYRHLVPIGFSPETGLAALGRRENRSFHSQGADPHSSVLNRASFDTSVENIVLRNVIAFDIQVYDPHAPLYVVRAGPSLNDPIMDVADPSEIGAVLGVTNGSFRQISLGAFTDLGKGIRTSGNLPVLFNQPQRRYRSQAVYDTGTSQYNNDEENDAGENGVDDEPYFGGGVANGIVDDLEEKASVPPYNVPLRGIRISMRVIEPNTKQIRQMTIVKSFIKE